MQFIRRGEDLFTYSDERSKTTLLPSGWLLFNSLPSALIVNVIGFWELNFAPIPIVSGLNVALLPFISYFPV